MVRASSRAAREEIERRLLARADVVLCRSPVDEREVRRMGTAADVRLLPGIVERRSALRLDDRSFAERDGVVVVGSLLDALSSPDEDAALWCAQQVFPVLRGIEPSMSLRVLVEDPTPILMTMSDRFELLPPGSDPRSTVSAARVVVIANRFGQPGYTAVRLALECGTPIVATALTADAFALTGLQCGPSDPVQLAKHLHRVASEPAVWELLRDASGLLGSSAFDADAYQATVQSVLVGLGVAPSDPRVAGLPLATAFVPPWSSRGLRRWRPSPLSESGTPPPMRIPDVVQTEGLAHPEGPGADAASYDEWRRARMATPARRATVAAEQARFTFRPLVSVVMPVFETDPALLHSAIESVCAQTYEHWELCLADDGSTNPETLAMLDAYRAHDSRIRIVVLDTNQGIAAASNAALAIATGEFVALLDHDDELDPTALHEVVALLNRFPELDFIYSDEDKIGADGRFCSPAFKPAWSPDLLLSANYVTHFAVYRRSLLEKVGGFRLGFDGSQDYDLALRVTELTDRIGHIAKPIYHWRMASGSTASGTEAKPYALDAAQRALGDALMRRGQRGAVECVGGAGVYRVRYSVNRAQRISIVIPTRDRVELLRTCIDSIRQRSTYDQYEIVVIDNGTTDLETLEYLALLDGRVLRFPHAFNFARMMNFAAEQLDCDQLLYLNNDVEIITPGWLEAMLEHAQRPEVGAVGARLYFPDGLAQHEGVFVGYGGGAGNVNFGGPSHVVCGEHFAGVTGGIVRNFAAVTAACMMLRPTVLFDVGGFEERLEVAFNDVDLSLKIRQRGYELVYTPYAELFHYESASRGANHPMTDDAFLRTRWNITDDYHDPYYSPNYDNRRAFALES